MRITVDEKDLWRLQATLVSLKMAINEPSAQLIEKQRYVDNLIQHVEQLIADGKASFRTASR